MLPEYERVRRLLTDFEPMTTKKLNVDRRKISDLMKLLSEEDREAFPMRAEFDVEAYILCAAAATRRYCINIANVKIVELLMPTFFAIFILAVSYFYYYWARV